MRPRNLGQKLHDNFGRLRLARPGFTANDNGLIENLSRRVMTFQLHDGVFVFQVLRRHGRMGGIHERRVGAIGNLKQVRWLFGRPTAAGAVEFNLGVAVNGFIVVAVATIVRCSTAS